MFRIFFILICLNFPSHSIYPTFNKDKDANLKVIAQLVQRSLCTQDVSIKVTSSNGFECCYIEATLEGLDLIRKNHLRHFRQMTKEMQGSDLEIITECLKNERISVSAENEICVFKLQDYETRKPLAFNIKVYNLRTNNRAYPAFGKTDEESLSIAVAVVEAALNNKTNGGVLIAQTSKNNEDLFVFNGNLQFTLCYNDKAKKYKIPSVTVHSNLVNQKIFLEKIVNSNKNEYEIHMGKYFDRITFQLNFTNSPNHQAWQEIYPIVTDETHNVNSQQQQELAYLFFKNVFVSSTKKNQQSTVGVYFPEHAHGERQWALVLSEGFSNSGLCCYTYGQKMLHVEESELERCLRIAVGSYFQPDFTLSNHIVMSAPKISKCSVLIVSINLDCYMSFLKATFPISILDYDAYLYCGEETDIIKKQLSRFDKNVVVGTLYPTVFQSNRTSKGLKKLFYCGCNWDNERDSEKYRQIFRRLEAGNEIEVYGNSKAWSYLTTCYKGMIPFKKNAMEEEIANHGISLCLHWEGHRSASTPTARFFEAVSVGSLVICDQHPFFQKYFGDCAFFIDTTQSADEIYTQIKRHLKWISENPTEATNMALQAQDLFNTKFSLNKGIVEVLAFLNKIKK